MRNEFGPFSVHHILFGICNVPSVVVRDQYGSGVYFFQLCRPVGLELSSLLFGEDTAGL